MARTIFLFIRGLDQTGRAFAGAQKNLSDVQKKQQEMLRSSQKMLFGSAALALGVLATTKGILGLMERTSQGSLVVQDFNRKIDTLKDTLGESFTTAATPWLRDLIKFFDWVNSNPILSTAAAWTVNLVVGISIAAIGLGASAIFKAFTAAILVPIGEALIGALSSAGLLASVTGGLGTVGMGILSFALPVGIAITAGLVINWGIKHILGEETGTEVMDKLGWIAEVINDPVGAGMAAAEWFMTDAPAVDPWGPPGDGDWQQLSGGPPAPSPDTSNIGVNVEVYGNSFGSDPVETGMNIGDQVGWAVKNSIGAGSGTR